MTNGSYFMYYMAYVKDPQCGKIFHLTAELLDAASTKNYWT